MKRAAREHAQRVVAEGDLRASGVRSTPAARSATPPKGSMSSGSSPATPVTRSAMAFTVKSRRDRSASMSSAKDTSGLRESGT